jgi:hypothetical protein
LRACVSGQAIPAGSTSPDVGRTAGPGDTCVVFDGVYNCRPWVRLFVVSVENLIVRSMNGATATIIQGALQWRPDQHHRARGDLWRPGT